MTDAPEGTAMPEEQDQAVHCVSVRQPNRIRRFLRGAVAMPSRLIGVIWSPIRWRLYRPLMNFTSTHRTANQEERLMEGFMAMMGFLLTGLHIYLAGTTDAPGLNATAAACWAATAGMNLMAWRDAQRDAQNLVSHSPRKTAK